MAKQKNNDKDLYGGLDLFNFMSSEVDKKIKDLEKRIINDNTTIEYNNNSRETDGLHRSEMGLFGREFDNGGIPTVETSSSRPQDSEIIELRASSGIEKMDMGVSDNQTTGRFNDSLFSISESSTDGRGDIGLTNSITTTSDGDYGYGDTRSEGNRPIQGSEASLRIYDIKEGEKLDFISNSEVIIGGAKDKYNKNIEAIKLLKTLENENRFAIFNEQEVLNSYTGWGGIPQAFDKENPTWSKEYSELKELLSTDEYESAKSSTLDSHYTPKIVIDSIYKSLKHFGLDKYNEPKEILEPSAGNGAFLSYVKNHFDNLNFTAIELDKTSSKLIKNLYPNQKVYNQGLEDYKSSKKFDAVIGNPPYGQKKIFDTSNPELSLLSIHNYFSARAIKELKDDGIMAFVTSSYFLDSKDHSLRDKISKQASFIGAIRLPNDTFKNKAGTEVTTDIIFFKKGFDKELHQDYNNLEVSSDTIDALKPITINEYFIKNPQNVLGQMQFVMSGIGETKQCVNVNNLDIEKELEKVISTLPSNIYKYHEIEKTEDKTLEIKNASNYHLELKNNSYFKHNNEIYKKLENRNDNRDIYCIKEDFTNPDKKRMDKYIDLRDSLNSLIKLEQTNISDNDERLILLREQLNKSYDEFVKKEGFLHKQANKKIVKEDVDGNKIIALEVEYNAGRSKAVAQKNGLEPESESAKKADIFNRRTISPLLEIKVTTPKEALVTSLNQFGKIDIDYMAEALDIKKDEVSSNLLNEKLIFIDHSKINEDEPEYVLAEKYLSGNVKKKYNEVLELVESNRELEDNLASLKEILPKDLKATDISVSLGTSWIPMEYYEEFFKEHFKIEKDDFNLIQNSYTGQWTFDGDGWKAPRDIVSKYATGRMSLFKIAESGLRNSPIKIYDTFEESDGKKRQVLNQKETALANTKLEVLKNDFNEWIFKDFDRRTHLEKIYNDRFNTDAEPKYNGQHLTLPNLNTSINLRVHQKDAVWRAVQDRNVLFDHQVGAGKTLATICSVMEQKRMGLVNKPLITVPNHLISQWEKEFYQAYPNTNLLVASKEDLEKNNREQFFSKIATNSYDAIIMTHSQFKLLPAPYETVKEQIQEDVKALEEMLETQKEIAKNSGKSTRGFSIKATEEKIKNFEVRLKNLNQENKKSKSIDFGDLGIDLLAVDESHTYKNLVITTSMSDISGLGNLAGSQQAYDMYCKTRFLNDNNNKVMFLTGTPISNSITELYTIQRYMQPDILKEKGIMAFDNWASTFGQVSSSWELDSSGVNYKIVSRFDKFNNVPELTKMYSSFADVITNKDIQKFARNFVPKLENDKPTNIIAPRSDAVADFIGVSDDNGNYNYGSIIWRMENQQDDRARNNLLACTTDARKAGLDFRLIEPDADDYENSKVNKVVNEAFKEWKLWEEDKGTQLIFCDLSVPKTNSQKIDVDEVPVTNKEDININDLISESKSNDELLAENSKFDLYTDILKKLVDKGVPQEEIRFIHDTKTDLQKSALFDDVKSGKVRFLLGSTFKMGAGTNVQDRVTAIHHIDCPWRPSDLEQRNGRVIRQGNKLFERDPENFRIKEFRYATEKTYDARMWQVIENKSRAIEQFRTAGVTTRELEDFSMGSADAAEMKAEATGNPFILMQVQLSSDLKKEEMIYNNYKKEIFNNEEALKKSIDYIPIFQKEHKELKSLKEHLDVNQVDNFKGSYYFKADDGNLVKKDFDIPKEKLSDEDKSNQAKLQFHFDSNLNDLMRYKENVKFITYRDITVYANRESRNLAEFYLKNEKTGDIYEPSNLSYQSKSEHMDSLKEMISLGGLIKRVDNYFNNVDKNIETTQFNINKYSKDVEDLKKVTGENTPKYKKADYLEALKKDNLEIISEIKKISTDKSYVSTWTPSSETIKNNDFKKPVEVESKLEANQQTVSVDINKSSQNSEETQIVTKKPFILKAYKNSDKGLDR